MKLPTRLWKIIKYTIGAAAILALLLLIAVRFAPGRFENLPLSRYDPDSGYRFNLDDTDIENKNSLFVCLVMSGGGTRSAAFSYGVLKALRDTEIVWPPTSGRTVRLLDEVDVISAVSGGAFAAAYYGLFGNRIFDDFEERVLRRNLESALTWRVAGFGWLRMLSSRCSRIDLAGEMYQEEIFEGRTFADLAKRRRPFIVLSATNMSYGSRFSFDQDHFDFLASDLSSFPIGRAVAASSAFPLLLSPVTLVNYGKLDGYTLPMWMAKALEDRLASPRQHARSSTLAPYHELSEDHPYLHLLDGGLSDNLGLRYVVDSYLRDHIRTLTQREPETPAGKRVGRIKHLLVIVVNAGVFKDSGLDKRAESPNEWTVAYTTATASMDNYSFETVQLCDELLQRRRQEQRDAAAANAHIKKHCPQAPLLRAMPSVDSNLIEVALRDSETIQLAAAGDERVEGAQETRLSLPSHAVEFLISEGERLLHANPEFRKFLASVRSHRDHPDDGS